jgi:PAS domain S-box-containing protein
MPEKYPAQVERLLRLLPEQSREHAFIVLGADGRVLWWSPGAEFMFSRKSAEMIGQPTSVLFTPDDVQKGIPQQEIEIARGFGKAEDDRWQVRPDGSKFWATGMLTALRDDHGNLLGYCKIIRNRTDLKEQLDTLHNQVEALTKVDQQKNIFLATLSHELRNPLTPLVNAVQLLRMNAPVPGNMEFPVKLIERQVDFIRRLVDDLSEVTRVNLGKVRLNKCHLLLRDVLNSAIEATRSLMEERRHNLQLVLPSDPIALQGDADRLYQVFVNLITNAVKFTPDEGRIWVKATTEGDEAVVRVEDTGVGIPHEMLPRIFDLFTQVDTPISHGGLGIGLALVKDLVAMHGGSVQVRSEGMGKGSEFTVRLPLNSNESLAAGGEDSGDAMTFNDSR